MSPHPLVAFPAGPVVVHLVLGRIIAAMILGVLIGFSINSDRVKARKDLAVLTEKSYAAGYSAHRDELKKSGGQGIGDVVAAGIVTMIFVVLYEASAIAICWVLGVMDNALASKQTVSPGLNDQRG